MFIAAAERRLRVGGSWEGGAGGVGGSRAARCRSRRPAPSQRIINSSQEGIISVARFARLAVESGRSIKTYSYLSDFRNHHQLGHELGKVAACKLGSKEFQNQVLGL